MSDSGRAIRNDEEGPIDLIDIARSQTPHALFERLRAGGPVQRTASGHWLVSGYEAANSLLRDRRVHSGPIAERYRRALAPGAARDEMSFRINFLDPPDHTRVRALASSAFNPRRIAGMAPWIAAQAARLLDELSPDADGTVDLLHDYAHPLPSRVISELLGVPDADRDQLTTWTEAVTPLLGVALQPAEKAAGMAASESFAAYARDLIAQRRAAPRDDLLSALVRGSPEHGSLTEPELMSLVVTLYSAGHRTTRDLFTNGLHRLLADRAQWARLVAEPALVSSTVREFLRLETPTLYVARVAAEPIALGGATLGTGETALVLLAAANRDPAVFTDPQRLDIARDEAAPLSFAPGAHFCLGAALARLEAETMLTALIARFPGLTPDPEKPPEWRHRGPFRGLTHLRVRPVA